MENFIFFFISVGRYPDSSVGGNGADREDGGDEDGVGDAELEDGLQEARVSHDVPHSVDREHR
jgi:hypothetical protein